MILPKLDYDSFLYGTASPSNLVLLDRIQYSASRIILGALRCTPVNALESEADVMPLKVRRRKLLTSYAVKILSIRDHPVRALLYDYL